MHIYLLDDNYFYLKLRPTVQIVNISAPTYQSNCTRRSHRRRYERPQSQAKATFDTLSPNESPRDT